MLSDLLRWGGKRPGQPDTPGERQLHAATSRSSLQRRSRNSSRRFPISPTRPRSSISAPSSAPTSRSSASSSAASSSSRICLPTTIGTRARERSTSFPRRSSALPPCRRERGRRPLLGLLRFPGQAGGPGAGAPDRPRAASRRRGHGLLLHLRRPSARRSRNTRSPTRPPCATGIIRAPAAPSTSC